MKSNAARGAVLGASVAIAMPVAFAAWATWVNPWFLDEPWLYATWILAPLASLGAVVGSRIGWAGKSIAVLGLECVIFVAASCWPKPEPIAVDLLMVGIDGATWDVIDRLDTPGIDGLEEHGQRWVLRSQQPMLSPIVWTTLATGESPAQHGIHGFNTQSTDCRSARIWDIAAESGRRIGIYKWLVTWPVSEPPTGGFMVPGWLASSPDTWPPTLSFIKEIELSARLKRQRVESTRPEWVLALTGIRGGLRFSTLLGAIQWRFVQRFGAPTDQERSWRLQLLRVQMDRDVFVASLHRYRPDLATFTMYATDALGHTHWGLMEDCTQQGCPPWSDAVPDAYRQADSVLAELVNTVTIDSAVMVLSDHGFTSASQSSVGQVVPLTDRLQSRMRADLGEVEVIRLGHKLTVTLLDKDTAGQRQRALRWLSGLIDSATGKPLYSVELLEDSEWTLGLTLTHARLDGRDLLVDTVGGDPMTDYLRLAEHHSGQHDEAGILLIRSPGLVNSGDVGEAELLDVAPTALNLMGLPAAHDMPGRVLVGAHLPRVGTYDHLVPSSSVDVPSGVVNEQQLRALGYIE